MLKTSNRPRAPSAATLRVLYQLAYISSGTAVGIGALCAEERRRRTQIVQRVADNAKRIRQSPRYAHGAAAVAVKEHEAEDNYGWSGNVNEAESDAFQWTETDRRRARRLGNQEGAKMPGLPSVVEEEYGKLVEGKHKKMKRRNRSGRPDFVEAHGHRESSTRADLEEQSSHKDRVRLIPTPSHLSSGTNKKSNSSLDWISYQKPLRLGIATGHTLKATSRKTHLFHATTEGEAYRNPGGTYDQVAALFHTRDLWIRTGSVKLDLSPEALSRDVDVFFEIVNANTSLKTTLNHACRVADELLRLSLDLGSVKAVRSLLLWKLAVKVLSVEDIFNAATSFASVAEKLDPEATMQFYSDLFATPVYRRASQVEKRRINLRLRAEALKLDTHGEDYHGIYEELINNIATPSNRSDPAVVALLDQECRRLMDSDHLSSAVKLWCTILSSAVKLWSTAPHTRQIEQESDLKLDAELFDAALTGRHISLCVRILRYKDFRIFGDSRQKDAFIKMCFEEGGTGLLQSLFRRKGKGALRVKDNLSPESYAYLSRSFAGGMSHYESFHLYYRRLPLEMRKSVAEASVNDGSFALKAQWKATRNLDEVRASYESALRRLEHNGVKEEDVRPLHVAMIEVELSANQTVTAIGALSQLNKAGSDGSVATLTALALAKQKEWATFGRLFEALKKNGAILDWTPPTKRAFNNVLHLFSRSHTARQLSDFAMMAFSELGFRPNEATWEVLLSGLVSKRATLLLKYWMNFSDASGSKFTVDSQIGAALMKRWYLDCRHSHVMVMWFCRNLARRASSLRSDALLNVVREAIGFDIRTLHGVNAPWMAPILRARQTLLDTSGGDLLKPGYIWNGQLYDKPRSTDGVEALPVPLMPDQDPFAAGSSLPPTNTTTDVADSKASTGTWVPYHTSRRMDGNEEFKPNQGTQNSDVEALIKPSPTSKESAASDGDAMNVSNSTSSTDDLNVEDVRLSYEVSYEGIQSAAVTSKVDALERQMISCFSLQQYGSALELYHESLDAISLPASPLMLEVAVEASLRLRNDRQEAEQIVSAARDAGMNVTCAMGPLLIDQIHRTSLHDRQDAAALRNQVLEYYRSNELNGIHVKHHVGTAAAHTLIQAGFAESGVNLLSTILQSSWCAEKPLDIAAMSVWLLGYARLGHVEGMHWVVEEVVEQGMSIDQGFLRSLKRARRPTTRLDDGPLTYRKQEPKTLAYLHQWYNLCFRKRLAQRRDSRVFGLKLVNLLATAASDGNAVLQPGRDKRRRRRLIREDIRRRRKLRYDASRRRRRLVKEKSEAA
jgi:hypothetical protein